MAEIITLDKLREGQSAKVHKVSAQNLVLRRRIMDMGIVRGVVITVIKVAPLGDPVAIAVRGYTLSVRKSDLALILGEVINNKKLEPQSEK